MSLTMCSRRNKGAMQAIFVIIVLAVGSTAIYFYHHLNNKLTNSNRLLEGYRKQHASLQSQLKVVYDHRAKLEKSLHKEKTDHKKTKSEKEENQQEHEIVMSRIKHEAANRFNALDTEHKMLNTKYENLDVEHKRLQQQHLRAVQDNQNALEALRKNMAKIKEEADQAKQWWYDSYNRMSRQKAQLEDSVKMYQDQINKKNVDAESLTKRQHEYIQNLLGQIDALQKKLDFHKSEAESLKMGAGSKQKVSEVEHEQVPNKPNPPKVFSLPPELTKTETKTEPRIEDKEPTKLVHSLPSEQRPPSTEQMLEQEGMRPGIIAQRHGQSEKIPPLVSHDTIQQRPPPQQHQYEHDLGFDREFDAQGGQAGNAGDELHPDPDRETQNEENTITNEADGNEYLLQDNNMHQARRDFMRDQNRMEMEIERENYNGQDPPISDQDQRTANHPDLLDDVGKDSKKLIANTENEEVGGAGHQENMVKPRDHLEPQQTQEKAVNVGEHDAETETKHEIQDTPHISRRSIADKKSSKTKTKRESRKKRKKRYNKT